MTFYIGIDVSSKSLDVALFIDDPSPMRGAQYANSAAGVKKLLHALTGLPVKHIVLEATGGYEMRALNALAPCFTVTRIASHRGTAFARSLGRFAKTDRIDAKVLARMAKTMPPQPYVPPTPAQQALGGLVKVRDQLIQQRDDNRRRLKQATLGEARDALARVNHLLDKEIRALDGRLQEAAQTCDAERAQQLAQVPGVGKVTTATLLAFLPELGRCGNRQISALVGVAPYTRQSGRWNGPRQIMAGRPFVRRALYMAALAAIRSTKSPLRAHYRALVARGKPAKVAIVACMRKLIITLNAMLRNNTAWRATAAG